MASPYRPLRDGRFLHATDAIEQIEQDNCSKGCIHGDPADSWQPGGSCKLLALVAAGDGLPIDELIDHGDRITCSRRAPLPDPSIHPGQGTLV